MIIHLSRGNANESPFLALFKWKISGKNAGTFETNWSRWSNIRASKCETLCNLKIPFDPVPVLIREELAGNCTFVANAFPPSVFLTYDSMQCKYFSASRLMYCRQYLYKYIYIYCMQNMFSYHWQFKWFLLQFHRNCQTIFFLFQFVRTVREARFLLGLTDKSRILAHLSR